MPTDKSANTLIINTLTEEQYQALANPSDTELWVTPYNEIMAGFPLFYHAFQDHVLNNASWLRADTFSWQSGAVYVSAYQHLVADISGITSETETISGTTITFYRANDGHKIVLADQESNVSAIYAATGVAWYYILDTTNTRFKLPRMLPLGDTVPVSSDGSEIKMVVNSSNEYSVGVYDQRLVLTGAPGGSVVFGSNAGLIANLSHTANDGAYKYLYFYVGNTVQDQTTIDVGEITEDLNSKADLDLSNVPSSKGILVESYVNGTSWYRVYSDGWCEQGGVSSVVVYEDITLLKPYRDTNGAVIVTPATTTLPTSGAGNPIGGFIDASTIRVSACNSYSPACWVAMGYLA